MIDSGLNAILNTYTDPRAGSASSPKDDAKPGAFDDALSSTKDDKPAANSAARDKPVEHADRDAENQPSSQDDTNADSGTERRLAARKFLENVANARHIGSGINIAMPGKLNLAEVHDAESAFKNARIDLKGLKGQKNDGPAEDLVADKDNTGLSVDEAMADGDGGDISANLAGTVGVMAENAISDIAKAIGKDAADDKSLRSREIDTDKRSATAKDPMLGIGANDGASDQSADTSGDSTFRFSSSRAGGGRSMDMTVNSREGRAEFEVKDSSGKVGDNVTVLDSRRFIGLAPSSNASSLASLITGDSDWVSAMQPGSELSNAAAQSSTDRVVHTLKLQMSPIELGQVTMSLRLVGEELAVHVTVENGAAYRKLSEDSKGIVDALRAQGLTVDQMTLSIAATDKSDQSGAQANGQQQQANQQASEGRNRDESGTRNGQSSIDDSIGANNGELDGTNGISSDGRSTGVYL